MVRLMGITLSRGAEPNTVARVSLIAIEEHWNLPSAMAALKALPEDRRDDSLALSERGDTLAHLDDLDDRRIAAMDAQGFDVQVISLAPPGIGAIAPADALPLSREANDRAAEAVRRSCAPARPTSRSSWMRSPATRTGRSSERGTRARCSASRIRATPPR